MKTRTTTLSLFLLTFTLVALTSCKDKKETKTEAYRELHASVSYQCPMDCEEGEIYYEPVKCPVCKMDLKEVKEGNTVTCTVHENGNCICEEESCECDSCPIHT